MAVPFSNTWCLPNSLRFKLNQAKEPNIQPNISPAPHSAIVRHSCRGSTIEFPRLNCSENSSMRSWVSFSSSHTSCPWSGIHGFLGRYQKLPETMVVLLIKYIYMAGQFVSHHFSDASAQSDWFHNSWALQVGGWATDINGVGKDLEIGKVPIVSSFPFFFAASVYSIPLALNTC